MSLIRFDLRSQSQHTPSHNSYTKQPPAPLVKIDLTPDKLYERKSSDHTNNQSSFNAVDNNSCLGGHLSTASSNVSLPPGNLTNLGSCSSITAKLSPSQPNLIANFLNSPYSIGSSPNQSKINTPLLKSSIHNPTSPRNAQVQDGTSVTKTSQLAQTDNKVYMRNSIKQVKKNSQYSIEDCSDEQVTIQQLQRKLEQQIQENIELKEQLNKEKQTTKMIITENLNMQQELKKAQQKTKDFEQLNQLRQSQTISSRSSWMRHSPNKKIMQMIQQQNIRGVKTSPKINHIDISADFSYDQYPLPNVETQLSQPIHQNQLSQHSILDILNNLNYEEQSPLTERQIKDSVIPLEKSKSVKVSQVIKGKPTSLSSQIRRLSTLTASYSRFENISHQKKIQS